MVDLVLVDPTFGVGESIAFLKQLERADVHVVAAYWVSSSGPLRWQFHVAARGDFTMGTTRPYEIAREALQASGVSIPLEQIKMIKPKSPMVAAMRKGYGLREWAPVRVIGASIDGVYIEDAILIRAVD